MTKMKSGKKSTVTLQSGVDYRYWITHCHWLSFVELQTPRELEYRRYLDDFISVSKNVPKTSYFASGLKWVVQTCDVNNGDLLMRGRLLLSNLDYYLRDVERDFLLAM
ncbi:uncharacterized protein LOC112589139 [Harpegnathos saltator]|uniref:uncharacterized protein LOC112589139 n=1 Tax=Harpegnathos saltator TaxID=610380 RepID=UPI000DBEE5B1|nr:uncharacterized protein LOC112589139 [Harpegnathos saltator]